MNGILAAGQLTPTLGRLSTPEERLFATAVIVILAVLAGGLLVPVVLRQVRRVVARRYLGGRLDDLASRVNERFPLTTPVRLLLRSLQVAVSVSTLLALLVVWGRLAVLDTVATSVQLSTGAVARALVTGLLLVGAYVGMGLLEDAVHSFRRETDRMTAHQEQIVTRVAQLSLLALATLLALGVWDVNLGGLLVGAGFLGIVVGLAARQTLGSLIAGFVLMLSRPFEIGDWVVVGDEEGIVTDITIVNTRLENFDGEFVVIPNDKVADRAITNRSQKGRLRIRVDVGIDYAADPARACDVAEEAIGTVDFVEETPRHTSSRGRSGTRRWSWRCGSGSPRPRRPSGGRPRRASSTPSRRPSTGRISPSRSPSGNSRDEPRLAGSGSDRTTGPGRSRTAETDAVDEGTANPEGPTDSRVGVRGTSLRARYKLPAR